jgi:hypothetical protein
MPDREPSQRIGRVRNRGGALAATLALASCGGDRLAGDALPGDTGAPDMAGVPPPPTLGAQLDRMGRPLIATALIGVFAADPAQSALRDAYNRAPDPAAWRTTALATNVTIAGELAANLAVFDALDNGLAVQSQTLTGCGNALKYGSPAGYQGAAEIFADDELHVDSGQTSCAVYLALELEFASAGTLIHDSCGGRTLRHDAIDATYSVLTSGSEALDPANHFAGRVGDGQTVHLDIQDGFPFLAAPH